MIIYRPIVIAPLTYVQEETLFFNKWFFDSHLWIEEEYYFKCKWCLETIGKNYVITSEKITMKLCSNNPYLKKSEGEGKFPSPIENPYKEI